MVNSMTKKKKKTVTKQRKDALPKSCKKKCDNKCKREKAYGDPNPVRPGPSYVGGEVYPRINFQPESLWARIKRFFGLS